MKNRPAPGDKALWMKFGAFGDVLQTLASIHRFKKRFPEVYITFMTTPVYADIVRQQPYVDDVLIWDVKKRDLAVLKIVAYLRKNDYRWLITTHGGAAAVFIALFSKIPKRFGCNRGMQFVYTDTYWAFMDSLGVDFTCRDEISIFADAQDIETAGKLTASLPGDRKLFAVIGASQRQKFWPAEHWKKFLRDAIGHGWGVVLNGHGDSEANTAAELEAELCSPLVLNLVGRLPFPLMAAVAQSCTVAVGNDTGPLHLAALTGTPTLGFFGVTDAYRMGYRMPWFQEERVTCPDAGCHDYGCPMDCVGSISPARAFDAFKKFSSAIIAI